MQIAVHRRIETVWIGEPSTGGDARTERNAARAGALHVAPPINRRPRRKGAGADCLHTARPGHDRVCGRQLALQRFCCLPQASGRAGAGHRKALMADSREPAVPNSLRNARPHPELSRMHATGAPRKHQSQGEFTAIGVDSGRLLPTRGFHWYAK